MSPDSDFSDLLTMTKSEMTNFTFTGPMVSHCINMCYIGCRASLFLANKTVILLQKASQ